jgi:hypothetical protein
VAAEPLSGPEVHPNHSRPQKASQRGGLTSTKTAPKRSPVSDGRRRDQRTGRSIRGKPAWRRPMPKVERIYTDERDGRIWTVTRYEPAKPEKPPAVRARWWPHRIPTSGQSRG